MEQLNLGGNRPFHQPLDQGVARFRGGDTGPQVCVQVA